MATINLGAIKFNWKGAYNSGTSYAVDDVVSSGGNSYVCIQAHSNQAVGNATAYWNIMATKGTNGTDADLLNIGSTAQGDLYYNSGSAIARLGAGTSGQFLKTQGTGANPTWSDAGGGLTSIQQFTSNGTYTKPSGINKIKVIVTGAGGSGGGGSGNWNPGGGGGAGGTAIELIDVSSLSSTVAVTVGIGGTSINSTSTNGNSGGSSSFGSYCTGNGGTGGAHADQNGYGDGGTATGGDLNIVGGDGGVAAGGDGSDERMTASGGASFWGGGGRGAKPVGSTTAANYGQVGPAFGSGGGAGFYSSSEHRASGAGANGVVYIEEYK